MIEKSLAGKQGMARLVVRCAKSVYRVKDGEGSWYREEDREGGQLVVAEVPRPGGFLHASGMVSSSVKLVVSTSWVICTGHALICIQNFGMSGIEILVRSIKKLINS
jgi:hypothetical protein